MGKRFVYIWFRYLHTDWFSIREPALKKIPFVLRTTVHGRMMIHDMNACAAALGIHKDMVLADARAIYPGLEVRDFPETLAPRLLKKLAIWCIRYAPTVAMDLPDGLVIDASGCPHLWDGEKPYLQQIHDRISDRGYEIRLAMADSICMARGLARYGDGNIILESGSMPAHFLQLPPEALQPDSLVTEKLHKLGLHRIDQLLLIPAASLKRRFGEGLILQLQKAMGYVHEAMDPVIPPESYEERLPCLEPVITGKGVEMALEQLLEKLCERLRAEQQGIREAVFTAWAIDGARYDITMATYSATINPKHLFKLFEIRLSTVKLEAGIEIFQLRATKWEEHLPRQEKIWDGSGGLMNVHLHELIDRLSHRSEGVQICRYLPAEHHLPERSWLATTSLAQEPTTAWKNLPARPLQLLHPPHPIDATAPVPDYPPMNFRYQGKLHKIIRADGPERIEQEWWIAEGRHRDYYAVEDESGNRYWLFRSGHYEEAQCRWFLHGFFA